MFVKQKKQIEKRVDYDTINHREYLSEIKQEEQETLDNYEEAKKEIELAQKKKEE